MTRKGRAKRWSQRPGERFISHEQAHCVAMPDATSLAVLLKGGRQTPLKRHKSPRRAAAATSLVIFEPNALAAQRDRLDDAKEHHNRTHRGHHDEGCRRSPTGMVMSGNFMTYPPARRSTSLRSSEPSASTCPRRKHAEPMLSSR
jgi:hypothetical protein